MGDHRVVLPLRRPAPQDRPDRARVPDQHVPVRGLRALRRRDRLRRRRTDAIRNDLDRLLDAIDERTVLVPLSLVLFRSSCIQDARAVIEKAHAVGAHVILDVYQAAGTVPLDIEALGADFAVGGSVKWLCGGPGAGYLYVRPDLARTLEPGVRRLGGARRAVRLRDRRRSSTPTAPERFQSGTPNVPALYAARAGYEIVAEIGVPAIREKSLRLTRRIIDHADARRLPPQHARRRSRARRRRDPRRAERRGGARGAAAPRHHHRLPAGRRHPHLAALLQQRRRRRRGDEGARRRRGGRSASG